MIRVHMFPVGVGDFLWVRFGKDDTLEHNILIDGGEERFCGLYKLVLQSIADKEQTAMIIMTHIDSDHIQAAAQALSELPANLLNRVIDKIYFNTGSSIRKAQSSLIMAGMTDKNPEEDIFVRNVSFTHSVKDGEKFMSMLERKGIDDKLTEMMVYPMKTDYKGACLQFISPGFKEVNTLLNKWQKYKLDHGISTHAVIKPSDTNLDDLKNTRLGYDTSITNKSSFAFIFEYQGKKGAFLGDASASVICAGLQSAGITKPYPVDFVKISHHGSMRNVSDKLLKALPTHNYLISTQGKPDSNVPSKITIAHMLKINGPLTIYNNYPWWAGNGAYHNNFFTAEDQISYINTGKLTLIELNEHPVKVDVDIELCGLITAWGER